MRRCRDDAVETLDTKLLSALVGDFKDAIGCDHEEIAGQGIEAKAIELRDGEKAYGKLRLLTLRNGLRSRVPVDDGWTCGDRAEDTAIGGEQKACKGDERGWLLHLRQDSVEPVEEARKSLGGLTITGVE